MFLQSEMNSFFQADRQAVSQAVLKAGLSQVTGVDCFAQWPQWLCTELHRRRPCTELLNWTAGGSRAQNGRQAVAGHAQN